VPIPFCSSPCGGGSHIESFDPKPALNQYANKSIRAST
jgi:hypothetical protein